MPLYKVSITKRLDWRGKTEYFSNIYTFFNAGVAFNFKDLAFKVRDVERPMFSNGLVWFDSYKVWAFVKGDKAATKMLDAGSLGDVQGSSTNTTQIYRENAILVKVPMGRYGKNNHPQFLKKWYHVCVSPTSNSDIINGTAKHNGAFNFYATQLKLLYQFQTASAIDGDFFLCSDDNRRPVADPEPYPYFEHRQFGR